MPALGIAPLRAEHLKHVSALEKMAGDVRWTSAQWETESRLPFARYYVVTHDHAILGYGGFWNVGEEAQITNIVVHPAHRRNGIGEALLAYLLNQARTEQCVCSTLEVRVGNQAAQALYQKAGFAVTGRRPRRYLDPLEDALLMEKVL